MITLIIDTTKKSYIIIIRASEVLGYSLRLSLKLNCYICKKKKIPDSTGVISKYKNAPNFATHLEYYKGRLVKWIHKKKLGQINLSITLSCV